MNSIRSRGDDFYPEQLRVSRADDLRMKRDSEVFIWRSFGYTASSAADKSCGSASGDGADWRSAWNCVHIAHSKSSCGRHTRTSNASTDWAWPCNPGHIADTWERDPRPSDNLRVVTSGAVPLEWLSRPYLEEDEDDSRVSRELTLLTKIIRRES